MEAKAEEKGKSLVEQRQRQRKKGKLISGAEAEALGGTEVKDHRLGKILVDQRWRGGNEMEVIPGESNGGHNPFASSFELSSTRRK